MSPFEYHIKDGIPISYTVELRDTGDFGFALPESQIRATAEENIEGIRKVYEHIRPGSEKRLFETSSKFQSNDVSLI